MLNGFELGKYYKHSTGKKLHICGLVDSYYYGNCFAGEDENGNLSDVGKDADNTVNWKEISKDEFIGY
jgi:hypothetical protein